MRVFHSPPRRTSTARGASGALAALLGRSSRCHAPRAVRPAGRVAARAAAGWSPLNAGGVAARAAAGWSPLNAGRVAARAAAGWSPLNAESPVRAHACQNCGGCAGLQKSSGSISQWRRRHRCTCRRRTSSEDKRGAAERRVDGRHSSRAWSWTWSAPSSGRCSSS